MKILKYCTRIILHALKKAKLTLMIIDKLKKKII